MVLPVGYIALCNVSHRRFYALNKFGLATAVNPAEPVITTPFAPPLQWTISSLEAICWWSCLRRWPCPAARPRQHPPLKNGSVVRPTRRWTFLENPCFQAPWAAALHTAMPMRMPVGNWRWRIKCPLSCRDASDNAFAAVNVKSNCYEIMKTPYKEKEQNPCWFKGRLHVALSPLVAASDFRCLRKLHCTSLQR